MKFRRSAVDLWGGQSVSSRLDFQVLSKNIKHIFFGFEKNEAPAIKPQFLKGKLPPQTHTKKCVYWPLTPEKGSDRCSIQSWGTGSIFEGSNTRPQWPWPLTYSYNSEGLQEQLVTRRQPHQSHKGQRRQKGEGAQLTLIIKKIKILSLLLLFQLCLFIPLSQICCDYW